MVPGFSNAAATSAQHHKGLVFIDQDDDAVSLVIDSEATSAPVIDIDAPAQTTGDIIRIDDANALTTGNILRLVSNSSSNANRELVLIHNDNASALGTRCLDVQQDAPAQAMRILQNANNITLSLESVATSSHVIRVSNPGITSGNVFRCIDANALTTGKILNLVSDSGSDAARVLVQITNDNSAAVNAIPLRIQQDAAVTACEIDQNADGHAIEIQSAAMAGSAIHISQTRQQTGNIINIPNADELTEGSILNLVSNSSAGETRELVLIDNKNASATGTIALVIKQNASLDVVFINQDANGFGLRIETEATSKSAISILLPKTQTGSVIDLGSCNSLTSGSILNLVSNSPSTAIRKLVYIENTHTASTKTTPLVIVQNAVKECVSLSLDTVDSGFLNFLASADNDTVSAISTLTTSGATTHHIQVLINGMKSWIAVSTNNPS